MSTENRLNNFRTRFERMNPAQKAATMSQLQVYIATQSSDPAVRACSLANQVENHFRMPPASVNAGWWNLLHMWKTSPLVERILTQV
jgi:hypothetical protein